MYRLANAPGEQSVKVKWQYPIDKLEPVLCEAKLAACPSGQDCPPFNCQKDNPALQDPRTTELGYGGPNADSQRDYPDAYVTKRDVSVSGFYPMRTILQGTIGDVTGKPFEVAVEVTSAVIGREPPYRLTYSIRTSAASRSLTIFLPERKSAPADVVVRWETVENEEFSVALRRGEAFRLSSDRLAFNTEISAKKFEQSSKLLVIMQGGETLAAVSAPAYVTSK